MTSYDTISLLTDYGTVDEFVGVMKAVIADIAPHVRTIDLTHGIPPFNVRAGALALARSIAYVPSGVIVAVVDPGVGGARRPVAIEVANGEGVLIGPDNGLLAPAVAMAGGAERAVVLTNTDYQLAAPGATFDGRDVFAPAAAHLCTGVALEALGELVDPAGLLPGTVPLPRTEDDRLIAEVLWIDRFGNCQLNLGTDDLPAAWTGDVQAEVGRPSDPYGLRTRRVQRARTFGDLAAGGVGLLVDGSGMLALSMNQRSVAEELDLAVGDPVVLSDLGPSTTSPSPTPVELISRLDARTETHTETDTDSQADAPS